MSCAAFVPPVRVCVSGSHRPIDVPPTDQDPQFASEPEHPRELQVAPAPRNVASSSNAPMGSALTDEVLGFTRHYPQRPDSATAWQLLTEWAQSPDLSGEPFALRLKQAKVPRDQPTLCSGVCRARSCPARAGGCRFSASVLYDEDRGCPSGEAPCARLRGRRRRRPGQIVAGRVPHRLSAGVGVGGATAGRGHGPTSGMGCRPCSQRRAFSAHSQE